MRRARVRSIGRTVLPTIVSASIFLGSVGFTLVYYLHENKQQINAPVIISENIFVNENGEYCYRFEPGQHSIKISRNDAVYHKIGEVDGYAIKEVEINGWRDNNKVTYVNVEPVIAIGTKDKDGFFYFNDFGRVETVNDIKNEIEGKTI